MTYKTTTLMNKIRKFINKIRSIRESNYSKHFNTSIKFIGNDWYINERIVEIPYVYKQIAFDGKGKRVLEFGCTKSELSLQLASLGYQVVGIDLRKYVFKHPKISFFQQNLLEITDNEGFDYITAISVIEHIGLGAYGEEQRESDLQQVTRKLTSLLKSDGKMIITVPFGQTYRDEFLRSFTRPEILSLFEHGDVNLIDEQYFCRSYFKFWQPCNLQDTIKISNTKADRGPSGVNCVGCFTWQNTISPKEYVE